MSRRQKELGVVALLAILAALAYAPLLDPDRVPYSHHSDLVAQHLAMKEVAHRSLQSGHGLPFWKSDLLSGTPALTHPQALYTNPFQLLFLFLDPLDAAGPTLWLHLLTMAVSLFVLGGVLGLDLPARAFMAVTGLFAFKLIAITYAAWLPVLPIFTCLPLLFAAVLRTLDRPGPTAGLALAAAGALCLHSGHLQLFYYALLLLTPYVLIDCAVRARAGEAHRAGRAIGWLAVAALLSAALSAYLMLPLAAEAHLTSRGDASYGFFLARRNFCPDHLATLLHPEILGTPLDGSYRDQELWEDVAYFGILPEILALVGILLGRRRRHVPFLATAFAASLILAFPSPLTRLLFEGLPGFALFRSPGRFLFLTTLLGLALAGVGLQELLHRARRHPARLRAAAVGLVFAAVTAEGVTWSRRYVQTAPPETVLPATRYAELFARDREPRRIAPFKRSTINYGWAAPQGLQLIAGFDAYNYRHYQDYLSVLEHGTLARKAAPVWTDIDAITRVDLLDALGVAYLVSPAPMALVDPAFRLAARFEDEPIWIFYRGPATADLYVYENRNARARAFWAGELVAAASEEDARQKLLSVDLRRQTLVQGARPEPQPRSRPSERIAVTDARGGHLQLELTAAARRYLVISEVWHPGWSATLDGAPLPLHQTNLTMLGAWIPKGSHRVELDYRPLWWRTAVTITLAGGLAAAALSLLAVRGRKQR